MAPPLQPAAPLHPFLTKPASCSLRPSHPSLCASDASPLIAVQASVKDFERGMHQPDPSEMRAVHEFIAATLSLKGV